MIKIKCELNRVVEGTITEFAEKIFAQKQLS